MCVPSRKKGVKRVRKPAACPPELKGLAQLVSLFDKHASSRRRTIDGLQRSEQMTATGDAYLALLHTLPRVISMNVTAALKEFNHMVDIGVCVPSAALMAAMGIRCDNEPSSPKELIAAAMGNVTRATKDKLLFDPAGMTIESDWALIEAMQGKIKFAHTTMQRLTVYERACADGDTHASREVLLAAYTSSAATCDELAVYSAQRCSTASGLGPHVTLRVIRQSGNEKRNIGPVPAYSYTARSHWSFWCFRLYAVCSFLYHDELDESTQQRAWAILDAAGMARDVNPYPIARKNPDKKHTSENSHTEKKAAIQKHAAAHKLLCQAKNDVRDAEKTLLKMCMPRPAKRARVSAKKSKPIESEEEDEVEDEDEGEDEDEDEASFSIHSRSDSFAPSLVAPSLVAPS